MSEIGCPANNGEKDFFTLEPHLGKLCFVLKYLTTRSLHIPLLWFRMMPAKDSTQRTNSPTFMRGEKKM